MRDKPDSPAPDTFSPEPPGGEPEAARQPDAPAPSAPVASRIPRRPWTATRRGRLTAVVGAALGGVAVAAILTGAGIGITNPLVDQSGQPTGGTRGQAPTTVVGGRTVTTQSPARTTRTTDTDGEGKPAQPAGGTTSNGGTSRGGAPAPTTVGQPPAGSQPALTTVTKPPEPTVTTTTPPTIPPTSLAEDDAPAG